MIKPPYALSTDLEHEIWAYLNVHPKVSLSELRNVHSSSQQALNQFWNRLRHTRALKPIGRIGMTPYYTIMDPSQAEALHKALRQGVEGKIWTTMRVHGEFTPDDLLASLMAPENAVTLRDIRTYCQRLTKAGYLRVLRKHIEGKRSARYRLIRNTGPLPPTPKRRMVIIDLNEDRAVYVEGTNL